MPVETALGNRFGDSVAVILRAVALRAANAKSQIGPDIIVRRFVLIRNSRILLVVFGKEKQFDVLGVQRKVAFPKN